MLPYTSILMTSFDWFQTVFIHPLDPRNSNSSVYFEESRLNSSPTNPLSVLKARKKTKDKTFFFVIYADGLQEMLTRCVQRGRSSVELGLIGNS